MSPISRRTGKRYAAGSHATFEHYPRVCAAGDRCLYGGPIVLAHQASLDFNTGPDETPRSWHVECRKMMRAEGGG